MKRVKPFEIKQCNKCDAEFIYYATNKNGYCKPCIKQYNKEKTRLKPEEKKVSYPYTPSEQRKRYTRLRQELNQCKTSKERSEVFGRTLEEMVNNGIWLWCVDRRPAIVIEKGSGKKGRKTKHKTDFRLKHPNTKVMPE